MENRFIGKRETRSSFLYGLGMSTLIARINKDEAILFSMHDSPILKAFGLYREEAQEDSTEKI